VTPERKYQLEQRRKRAGRKPAFGREQYRRRNVVGRDIGWLRNLRRIATRSETLARYFSAVITIALLARYATRYLSDTT
jgi:transposase